METIKHSGIEKGVLCTITEDGDIVRYNENGIWQAEINKRTGFVRTNPDVDMKGEDLFWLDVHHQDFKRQEYLANRDNDEI